MQTKILLAHRSFIVLKGLSAVINSMDFLASIRFCSDVTEFASMIAEDEDDIIIAAKAFTDEVAVLKHQELLTLDHGEQTDDLAILSWEDPKDVILHKIKSAVQRRQAVRESGNDNEELSDREKDIVIHVAQGLTNQEIADKLFISSHTVITHRKNIVKKLGIKTVSGLTVYAILNNLINMDEIDLT